MFFIKKIEKLLFQKLQFYVKKDKLFNKCQMLNDFVFLEYCKKIKMSQFYLWGRNF